MAAHLVASDPDKRVGTAILLKVMPGDKFSLSAKTYYEGDYNETEETGSGPVLESLLSALMGGSTYAGVPVSELPENIQTVQGIFANPALASRVADLQAVNDIGTVPKAHLNYLFFNDNFELQAEQSGSLQVQPNGTGWGLIDNVNICNCTSTTPAGPGFILVYVDNQSIGKDVWFDDIHIEHYTSKVLEENHYYPFGMTVQLDNNAANTTKNDIKFQGQRLDNDLGINIYSFKYREHDPTIGRFWQIDPLSDKYVYNSPYAFSENKVTSHFELEGLEAVKLGDGNTLYGPWNSNLYTGKWGQKLGIPQMIKRIVGPISNTPSGEGKLIRAIVKFYQLGQISEDVYQADASGNSQLGDENASNMIENPKNFYYNSSISYDEAMDAAVIVQAHEYIHIGQKTKLGLPGNEYDHTKREFFANFFNLYPNSIGQFEGTFFPNGFKTKWRWPEVQSSSLRKSWTEDVKRFYGGLNEEDKEKYKELIEFVEKNEKKEQE